MTFRVVQGQQRW